MPRANPRDVIVSCGERHRVRLARGPSGFWRKARCPRCREVIDPWRTARIGAWWKTLLRPATRTLVDRCLWAATAAYLLLVLVAAVLLWTLADRWWPATTLLFGPRWVLALPLALLVPFAAIRDRALLVPLTIAGVVVIGPIMDVRSGWRGLLVGGPRPGDVTVATLNARGGPLTRHLGRLMQDWEADIVVVQECGSGIRLEVEELGRGSWSGDRGGFETDARSGLCLLTRLPLLEVTTMERAALRAAGGSGLVVTYTLDVGGTEVGVTNIHLETPRAGFELLRRGRIVAAVPMMREKSALRAIELREGRRFTDAFGGPRIVAGDFNTPVESVAYRRSWSDWTNAFSRVGRGLGGTRLNGWIRPRIDHVLVDGRWKVIHAHVGEAVGSDHLPMIATVRLR